MQQARDKYVYLADVLAGCPFIRSPGLRTAAASVTARNGAGTAVTPKAIHRRTPMQPLSMRVHQELAIIFVGEHVDTIDNSISRRRPPRTLILRSRQSSSQRADFSASWRQGSSPSVVAVGAASHSNASRASGHHLTRGVPSGALVQCHISYTLF